MKKLNENNFKGYIIIIIRAVNSKDRKNILKNEQRRKDAAAKKHLIQVE